MKKRLQRWFSSGQQRPPEDAISAKPVQAHIDDGINVQRELQTLRMELEAREQRIAQLNQEIARLRERQETLVTETVAARLESLAGELAAPASQIRTQAYLVEDQNKAVQAQDVLSVARRMIRALERQGMTFEGEIGAQVAFDPNLHTPINADPARRSGDTVTVRFSGVRYQGKMIYKAIVG